MTLIDVLILLLVAGICGALGQAIAGYSRGGCLVSIALGFVGALIGMWMARVMGLPELIPVHIGGTSFPIVWSIIGSALFVAVIALDNAEPGLGSRVTGLVMGIGALPPPPPPLPSGGSTGWISVLLNEAASTAAQGFWWIDDFGFECLLFSFGHGSELLTCGSSEVFQPCC